MDKPWKTSAGSAAASVAAAWVSVSVSACSAIIASAAARSAVDLLAANAPSSMEERDTSRTKESGARSAKPATITAASVVAMVLQRFGHDVGGATTYDDGRFDRFHALDELVRLRVGDVIEPRFKGRFSGGDVRTPTSRSG